MKKTLVLLCIGLIGLFAIGCGDDPEEGAGSDSDADSDNDSDADSDSDGDSDGDDACIDCGSPEILLAEPLTVSSGCATYVGAHQKTPDGEHIQTYEFCADGTATKLWNPVPGQNPPGQLTCTGTWSGDGSQLIIDTKCSAASIGGAIMGSQFESYEYVFTYENGAKLDLLGGQAQVGPRDGSTVIGSYAASEHSILDLGEILYMDITEDVTTVVTNGHFETITHTILTSKGLLRFLYGDIDDAPGIVTSGPLTMPGTLYDLGGTYMLQTSKKLVLERQ